MCYEDIKKFIEEQNPYQTGLLGEIEQSALCDNIPIISKEVAGFLSLILKLKRPNKILELGTAVAYSTILMSQFVGKNKKDNKEAEIITIEHSKKMIEKARKNITKSKVSCIKLIEGDIENILYNLYKLKNNFDIIFFDAAKGQYIKILPICLELLADDGIIIADDIMQNGRILKKRLEIPRRQRTIYTRMNQFIKKVFSDKNLDANIFNIGDGVIVLQKKLKNLTS